MGSSSLGAENVHEKATNRHPDAARRTDGAFLLFLIRVARETEGNTTPVTAKANREIVACLLGLIGVGLFWVGTAMNRHFVQTRPHESDPSKGWVYTVNEHGGFHYITLAESIESQGLMISGWLLLVAAIMIGRRNS